MKNKNFSNITKERIINNEIQLARIDNEKKTFHTSLTLKTIDNYLKKISAFLNLLSSQIMTKDLSITK